jgi:holo-[acyl-carrier protein] synthase
MLLGLGTDIVDLTRLARELAREDEDLRESVFTARELERSGAEPALRLACAFAAKEAFFKALGHGWQGGLAWHDVELDEDGEGQPRLELRGAARVAAERLGVAQVHLSISAGARLAMATVVLET